MDGNKITNHCESKETNGHEEEEEEGEEEEEKEKRWNNGPLASSHSDHRYRVSENSIEMASLTSGDTTRKINMIFSYSHMIMFAYERPQPK